MNWRFTILGFLSLLLVSCAGYQLGGAKPEKLSHIKSIAVPQFKNLTLEPRLSSLATNSFVDAITQDGTYQVSSLASADATLVANIETIQYSQYRANRFDTLASDELTANVKIQWKLMQNGIAVDSGTASGRTNFFAEDNLQLSRDNALPVATLRAAQSIVTSITEGF